MLHHNLTSLKSHKKQEIIQTKKICVMGDKQMIDELIKFVGEEDGTGKMSTSIERSMESHYVSLAAEYSR